MKQVAQYMIYSLLDALLACYFASVYIESSENNAINCITVYTDHNTLYCGIKVIISRISGSDKYPWLVLVICWGECSPIVEDIMRVLVSNGLNM